MEVAGKDRIEICGDKIWQKRGYEAAHHLRSTRNLCCTTFAVFGKRTSGKKTFVLPFLFMLAWSTIMISNVEGKNNI